MTIDNLPLFSDLAIPPGETLAEDLDFRGMTTAELAKMLGQPFHMIEEIIRGERAITEDLASALADALGIPAQFWLNLEAHYQETLARVKAQPIREAGNGN